MPVPTDIAIAYLIQGSFYGHSIYATIYMDAWRKDSAVMVVHHIITLALICFSYAFRYFTLSQCSRASVRTLHNAPIWKCFFKRWTAHCSFLFVKRMWQSRNLLLLCSRRLLLELLTVATFRRARMWIIGGVGGAKLRVRTSLCKSWPKCPKLHASTHHTKQRLSNSVRAFIQSLVIIMSVELPSVVQLFLQFFNKLVKNELCCHY